jgi:c-di-GMP-binding flagellar brake protein YcgR
VTAHLTATAMLSRPLKVWEKIELVVGDSPNAGRYLARIQDFINGGIVITEPEFIEGSILLREDIDVKVLVTRDDAIYQFSSRIHRMIARTSTEYLLTPPNRFERVQRRMFVRVDTLKKMAYAVIMPLGEWQSYDDNLTWKSTQTIDLSGGGMQFKVADKLTPGTPLLLQMDYFKEIGLAPLVTALVRRCYQKGDDYFCGVEFQLADTLSRTFSSYQLAALPDDIQKFDRNAQNRLATHVFQLQVNLRQKGLL